MPPPTIGFDTGPAVLPDVGMLNYNGLVFSPLWATTISGQAVKDDAGRTVKYMEYTLTADGYVTLPDGATDISPTMARMRLRLEEQGGQLVYRGRGMDLLVNPAGGAVAGSTRDVAWGPVPEVLEFQPLGAGRSAKVVWRCKIRIPELARGKGLVGGVAALPLLQFNYETALTYGEDNYSGLSISGTLEVAMTRPGVDKRTLTNTVDDARSIITNQVLRGIDLSRFRVTKRDFKVSRDKRTLTWDFQVEEKPYMDLPRDCSIARGSYSVRPAKSGMGLCNWLCTLRATYTIRADRPRRLAWTAFLLLLRWRMAQSKLGYVPRDLASPPDIPRTAVGLGYRIFNALPDSIRMARGMLAAGTPAVKDGNKAWLLDLSIDEGLYLDSKTTSFSATWRLVTTFSHILLASGLWKKVPETNPSRPGENLWAVSMADIQGSQSWMINRLDPALDVIVDFGT